MPTTTARPKTAALKRELSAYFKKCGFDIDTHWYSKTAWKERGEPFGNEAALSLTFEGPLYEALNYGEWGGYRAGGADDVIHTTARKYGFYAEMGYAWSLHFHAD